jgi:hypothetical protein
MATFRVILALSVELGLKVTHVDIGNAFLHGVLDETIYMHYPRGYKGKEGTILLLLKSIYGLKQASRVWGKKLAEVLLALGFTPLKSDTCVFVNQQKSFWITVHVDDLLMATADEQARSNLIRGLSKIFKVKDLGVVSTYLGAHVNWGKDQCKIDQRVYIDKMVMRFSMEEAKPINTPMAAGVVLDKSQCPSTDEEIREMSEVPYRSLPGSLLYDALLTRADIAYPTQVICKFNENPGRRHWKAGQRILKYLKSTRSHGTTYQKSGSTQPLTDSDSDWADNKETRKSQSGWIVRIANGAVDWSTNAQKSVGLSSCEAEYVAASEAFREVL